MTGLGATIYLGFFTLAALWLYVTSDDQGRRQGQQPERSNSASTAVADDRSSPWLVSQSSSK